jgi:hypothetical protein
MRLFDSLCLTALLYAAPAAAQDDLPSPTTLRYDENWSVLYGTRAASVDPLGA